MQEARGGSAGPYLGDCGQACGYAAQLMLVIEVRRKATSQNKKLSVQRLRNDGEQKHTIEKLFRQNMVTRGWKPIQACEYVARIGFYFEVLKISVHL